jgi:hypothetical protein
MVAMIVKFTRALSASCLLWTFCQTVTLPISQAAESDAYSSYQRVAANLDAGGVIYLYWSAEKALGELDKKLEAILDLATSDPSLSPDENSNLRKNFGLGIHFIVHSGLQSVKAFGLSSREIEPGLFLNKTYTYLPDRTGFLWDSFAKTPHDFPFLKMVPEKGQMLTRQDVEEYMTEWPRTLVGETYEVGIVGEPPYATAPVDLGDRRAGSKIEP